jgi:proline iminopeptidase
MRVFVAITLAAILTTLSCTDRPTEVPVLEEGYLEVNGTTLFYKTMGSGEPIVVLHGGPGFDHRQFLPYIWQLADDYKIILFDQRGTGLSSGPVNAESISIDNFIADIEAVRTAFNIDKMNLLGHSWGGILAMHYGIQHPEQLRSLILCSTAASVDSFGEMRANYENARLPEDVQMLEEMYSSDDYQNGDPQAIERFWRVYFKPYFADPERVAGLDLHFEKNTIENGTAVARFMMESVGEFDLHEDLAVIRCPTLVLHGDSDPMPVTYAERIRDSISGSRLVIAENSGHWLFVDATETFSASIHAFLADVSSDRR